MNTNFLTEIEIKNFKCFDDFKADGFKRVNLISGKNNVGKTAFMEACGINLNGNEQYYVNSMLKVIRQRDNFFLLNNSPTTSKFFKVVFFYKTSLSKIYQKNLKHVINSNVNKTYFTFEKQIATTNIKYNVNGKDYNTNILINDIKEFIKNSDYHLEINDKIISILPVGIADEGIVRHYSFLQRNNREIYLNEKLKIFDANITDFKIINNIPEINVKSNGYIPLSQLGDGIKHFVNIIISLFASENGHLFIDEIDNGIHYTQLDKLWEIILTVSKELNCQVFATTHSKECIESYYRTAKKLEDEDITFILLTKLKSGKIHSSIYDYELLENSIEQDHEVRGW